MRRAVKCLPVGWAGAATTWFELTRHSQLISEPSLVTPCDTGGELREWAGQCRDWPRHRTEVAWDEEGYQNEGWQTSKKVGYWVDSQAQFSIMTVSAWYIYDLLVIIAGTQWILIGWMDGEIYATEREGTPFHLHLFSRPLAGGSSWIPLS